MHKKRRDRAETLNWSNRLMLLCASRRGLHCRRLRQSGNQTIGHCRCHRDRDLVATDAVNVVSFGVGWVACVVSANLSNRGRCFQSQPSPPRSRSLQRRLRTPGRKRFAPLLPKLKSSRDPIHRSLSSFPSESRRCASTTLTAKLRHHGYRAAGQVSQLPPGSSRSSKRTSLTEAISIPALRCPTWSASPGRA